eukprot:7588756-Pyramimonas_sp.AAC.1
MVLGSGRVGSGRVGSSWVRSGQVGSGRSTSEASPALAASGAISASTPHRGRPAWRLCPDQWRITCKTMG